MKKIGLLTQYSDNFGSILQCYATKQKLIALGFECVVISIKPELDYLKLKKIGSLFNHFYIL